MNITNLSCVRNAWKGLKSCQDQGIINSIISISIRHLHVSTEKGVDHNQQEALLNADDNQQIGR